MHWSAEAARIHGQPLDAVQSVEQVISFYVPEDRPRVREAFERCARDGMPFDREVQLVRADDGAVRWVGAAGRAQRDEKGRGHRVPAVPLPATGATGHSSTRPWSRSGTARFAPFAPLGIEAEGSAYPHDHGLTIYFRDVSRHRSLGPPSNDGNDRRCDGAHSW